MPRPDADIAPADIDFSGLVDLRELNLPQRPDFIVIAHNGADSVATMQYWDGAPVTDFEIDALIVRREYAAYHSRGLAYARRVWPRRPTGLREMVREVRATGKGTYIDHKGGDPKRLVRLLENEGVLGNAKFVQYGRARAERFAQMVPGQVFLDIANTAAVEAFAKRPNVAGLGVCLSPALLTRRAIEICIDQDAPILATFVNGKPDVLAAFKETAVVGITTDRLSVAAFVGGLQGRYLNGDFRVKP